MLEIDYWGSFDDPSGYGAVARGYASSLMRRDDVNLKLSPHNFFAGQNEGFVNKNLKYISKGLSDNCVSLQHYTPDHYKKKRGTNIGYTAWELNRIPRDWISRCANMSEIWVPSKFTEDAFHIEGVTNTYIIPHGIDFNVFSPDVLPIKIYDAASFNFLSIFQWNYRKGYDVLLKAFLSEFSAEDNVSLILKTFGFNSSPIEEQRIRTEMYRLYKKTTNGKKGPKIIYIRDFISDLASLYNIADAFVLPVRGGGWEMCYLEALACGLPVIGTLCGGQSEYLSKKNALIVEILNESSCTDMEQFHYYDSGMKWGEPDVLDLADKMRAIYEEEELRNNLRKNARSSIAEFTWDNAVDKMIKRLEDIL